MIQVEHPTDVERIMRVARTHGIFCSPFDAQRAWQDFSDSMAAGWMILPNDDNELWDCLPSWFKGVVA